MGLPRLHLRTCQLLDRGHQQTALQANGVGGSFGGRGCLGTWGDQCKCCFSALTRTPLSSLSPLSGGQSNPDCFVFYQNSQKTLTMSKVETCKSLSKYMEKVQK